MNNLSWFLYLVDVLPNIATVAAFVSFFCVPGLIFWLFVKALEHQDPEAKMIAKVIGFLRWLTPILLVIALFVPSKDTLYLIAASEAGEVVVNTPEAKEVMSDLKEILNIQLEKLKQ